LQTLLKNNRETFRKATIMTQAHFDILLCVGAVVLVLYVTAIAEPPKTEQPISISRMTAQ
jgi:hypothetical protein